MVEPPVTVGLGLDSTAILMSPTIFSRTRTTVTRVSSWSVCHWLSLRAIFMELSEGTLLRGCRDHDSVLDMLRKEADGRDCLQDPIVPLFWWRDWFRYRSASDPEDPRGVLRSYHGDALVHSVAQGVRHGGGAIQRTHEFPLARRQHGRVHVAGYEALYNIQSRTLKLTTPTNGGLNHLTDAKNVEFSEQMKVVRNHDAVTELGGCAPQLLISMQDLRAGTELHQCPSGHEDGSSAEYEHGCDGKSCGVPFAIDFLITRSSAIKFETQFVILCFVLQMVLGVLMSFVEVASSFIDMPIASPRRDGEALELYSSLTPRLP